MSGLPHQPGIRNMVLENMEGAIIAEDTQIKEKEVVRITKLR